MAESAYVYEFGPFVLEVGERRLFRNGAPVALTGKAFDTLAFLVQNHGRLVRKQDLYNALWPDAIVEESNLNYNVSIVRKALGEKNTSQQYIETVPRQGYRFVAAVRRREAQSHVVPPSVAASSPPEPELKLVVERQAELDRLRAALDRARTGSRQIVFVTGESGLGKTTLVNAFVHGVRKTNSAWIARGQCLEHRGEAEAYMPVLEALGRLCRQPDGRAVIEVLDRHAPSWLVQMPGLVGPEHMAQLRQRLIGQTRERMLREMVEALETLTAGHALIMVLEDLHWSDQSTLDLLSRIARGQDSARLIIIATYRPSDAKASSDLHALAQDLKLRASCESISLGFLSEDGISEYLKARFGSDFGNELSGLLLQRTEGNPLFVTALLNEWLTKGYIKRVGDAWQLTAELSQLTQSTPDSLREFIDQQIYNLPPEQRAVLEAASVAGNQFCPAAIAAALDKPLAEAESTCESMAEAGRFFSRSASIEWPDGTLCEGYQLVHSLYAEVIYERLPAGRRVRLHQQIGLLLEQVYRERTGEIAAELAMHFRNARDARRALKYLILAAEQALGRSAPREAILHLDGALSLLPRLPDLDDRNAMELEIQTMRAPALVATRGYADSEAEAAYRRAYELSKVARSEMRFPIVFALATMLELRGEYPASQALMEEHLPQQVKSDGFVLEARDLLACSTYHQGAFNAALKHAAEGMEAYYAEHHSPLMGCFGENPGIGCYTWAALASWFLGFPDQALAKARKAVELAEKPDLLYTLANTQAQLAIVHQLRCEVEDALAWAESTIELATRQGFGYRVAIGQALRGWAWARQGMMDEGLAELQSGLNGCRTMGAELDRPYFLGLLAETLLSANDSEVALKALDEATDQVTRSRSFFYEAELLRLRAKCLLSGNGKREQEAESCLRRSLEIARRQQSKSLELRSALDLARLLVSRGDTAEAVALVRPVYDWFSEGLDTSDLKSAASFLQKPRAAKGRVA